MFQASVQLLQDDTENYMIGGYHSCYVGEILNDRYVILKKIEMTVYASIWIARDVQYNIYVTIKIYKSAPSYNEIALDEVGKLHMMHKKSKEGNWLYRLYQHRELLNLSMKISESESFCVK